ncbi:MAG: 2,4-dihydroxyhept-2-ene-1,7-dioic acid aldolase [Litoreibacter sp.]|nr:2,4-dihydroxyhept-2-ene-1,7-dioic acid aldolase [Litoreibacter sp.]
MMTLKSKLQATNDVLSMHICTIPSATVPQAIAAAGADSIIVDLEHGAIDYADAHAMIAATAGTGCAPLVRIAKNTPTDAKRALDLGAEGLVFPLIRTAQDAEDAFAALKYPPAGTRGFGPFLAQARWQTGLLGYREAVEDKLVNCLLVETKDAVENIEAICAVPGIDLLVPAPFDLSTDLGVSGQFTHPDFTAAIAKIEAAANKAGIPLGGVGLTEEQAKTLIARNYRVIVGFDVIWLDQKTRETQGWLDR